jgi:hydrogenase nickel incorporation protein HypB
VKRLQIDVNANIMEINNAYAGKNRGLLRKAGVLTLNIMGSPGAGKTTLVERLLAHWQDKLRIAVIEGDLATAKDAERVAAFGAAVVQINTGGGCHLDAKMISRVMPGFDLGQTDLLIIENVGNLVCPAGFDLGEDIRIVVMSVTEGSDKPAKYPSTFLTADWLALNKIDLLPYTDFDLEAAKHDLDQIKQGIRVFELSCRPPLSSEQRGIEELAAAIEEQIGVKRSAAKNDW